MKREPDYGYWDYEISPTFNQSQKTISNGYISTPQTPVTYILSTSLDLSAPPLKYIREVRFETDVDETEQVVAEICSPAEWLSMTTEEQSAYLRNHPLYNAEKQGVYYSVTSTVLLALVGTKRDSSGDKVVLGNFNMGVITQYTGSVFDYKFTWWDDTSNYVDKIYMQCQLSNSIKYFKGYNSSGSMIYSLATENQPLSNGIKLAYRLEYPWQITPNFHNDYPYSPDFASMIEKSMEEPYPSAMWTITPTVNEGYPCKSLFEPMPRFGAFANDTNLQRINIPQTVSTIGVESFRNTSLQQVTISRECEYYPTTFPESCTVNRY